MLTHSRGSLTFNTRNVPLFTDPSQCYPVFSLSNAYFPQLTFCTLPSHFTTQLHAQDIVATLSHNRKNIRWSPKFTKFFHMQYPTCLVHIIFLQLHSISSLYCIVFFPQDTIPGINAHKQQTYTFPRKPPSSEFWETYGMVAVLEINIRRIFIILPSHNVMTNLFAYNHITY